MKILILTLIILLSACRTPGKLTDRTHKRTEADSAAIRRTLSMTDTGTVATLAGSEWRQLSVKHYALLPDSLQSAGQPPATYLYKEENFSEGKQTNVWEEKKGFALTATADSTATRKKANTQNDIEQHTKRLFPWEWIAVCLGIALLIIRTLKDKLRWKQ